MKVMAAMLLNLSLRLSMAAFVTYSYHWMPSVNNFLKVVDSFQNFA
jgi:hypothetical protein